MDPRSNQIVENKLVQLRTVMSKYATFENNLGFSKIDIINLVDLILTQFSNN